VKYPSTEVEGIITIFVYQPLCQAYHETEL
jgi:hypothetical protein